MLDSITAAFSEAQDFGAALRADGLLSLLTTASGRFEARLTRISLRNMRLSAIEEQLPRIAFVAVPADTLHILFPMGNSQAPVCGSVRLQSRELLTLHGGTQFHARVDGVSHWGTISLPMDRLISYGTTLTGSALLIPPGVQRWRPRRDDERDLRRLQTAAVRMAHKRPKIFSDNETARGLEQQLLHAAVDCLSGAARVTQNRADRRNQEIMVRFEQLLMGRPNEKPEMSELCASLRVSERRLRLLCAAHLRLGPMAYDRLKRLALARNDLRAEGASASVSAVARSTGFHNLSRFAINYRAAFGEAPSTTLRRRGA